MHNIGLGYLVLFCILTAPFVFWCYNRISKTLSKDDYKDEFDREQEWADYWNLL